RRRTGPQRSERSEEEEEAVSLKEWEKKERAELGIIHRDMFQEPRELDVIGWASLGTRHDHASGVVGRVVPQPTPASPAPPPSAAPRGRASPSQP
ncbi:MAG: hypothetical protein OEY23_23590, partial [Acidimicrobiia bacterium]|nr:hypothetical protein [Acidimicrobiia bacterium]